MFCKEIENLQKKESRANYLLSKNKQDEDDDNQKKMFGSGAPVLPPDLNKSISDSDTETEIDISSNH